MNKKSKIFITTLILLTIVVFIELIYLYQTQTIDNKNITKKQNFITLTGLPDLALANDASFVRHRSLSSIFDIYRDGENLHSYFPTASIYWHSTIVNHTPNKVIR
jgi:hypothetical protein